MVPFGHVLTAIVSKSAIQMLREQSNKHVCVCNIKSVLLIYFLTWTFRNVKPSGSSPGEVLNNSFQTRIKFPPRPAAACQSFLTTRLHLKWRCARWLAPITGTEGADGEHTGSLRLEGAVTFSGAQTCRVPAALAL